MKRWKTRRGIAMLVGAAFLVVVVPASAGTLDQEQPNGSAALPRFAGVTWLAQTFTAGRTGDLDEVQLYLHRGGDGVPGPLTAEIRTVSGGVPSGGPPLATETVPDASVPTSLAFFSVPLSPAVAVTQGTQYAIVAHADGAAGFNFYEWGGTGGNTDPYPGGTVVRSGDGGAGWSGGVCGAPPYCDMAFKTFVADITPPLVTASFLSPDGQNGWFVTSPVTGSVTANDTTTGGNTVTAISCAGATVGSITGLGTPSASAPLTVSAEGVNNISCTATDSAGNSGAAPGSDNTETVQIDSVAPGISITSPTNGGTYTLNAAVASSYSCGDATSGVATCTGPVVSGANFSTSPVGLHAFTVGAADVAGNPAQATNTYNVVYDFSGFFSPVDNTPVFNVAKAGSAIPVKFSLSGFQGLSIFAAGYPASQNIACNLSAADVIEETATAGSSSLSYDATLDQYTYVWKTLKSWTGTCRQLALKLNDGTYHRANFLLR